MSPSSPTRRNAGTRTTCGICALLLVCWTAVAVHAHPLTVTTGTLQLEGDRLIVTMDATAHVAEHSAAMRGGPNEDALRQEVEALASGVIMLDEHGVQLPTADARPGSRAWRLNPDQHFAVLRFHPGEDATTPAQQAYLRIGGPGQGAIAGVVRLTGPDVAGVVDVQALRPDSGEAPAVLSPESSLAGSVELHVLPDRVEAHVQFPATAFRLWRLMPRDNEDVITAANTQRWQAAFQDWLKEKIELRIDGEVADVHANTPEWLGPAAVSAGGSTGTAEQDAAGKSAGRNSDLCFWSARVHLTLVAKLEAPPRDIRLTCSAFHPAMLGMDARILDEHEVLLVGDLTAYQPQLGWRRENGQTLVRIGHRETPRKR